MTEHILQFQIELRSPLLMGTDREYALFVETRDYVPGGVLRGSLARLLQEQKARQEFAAMFGAGTPEPFFENLHPSWSAPSSYPRPLSARTCKHHEGFKSEGEAQHGVGDILSRQSVFEEMVKDTQARLPLLYTPRCPTCKSEVEPPKTRFYEETAGNYQPIKAPVRRISRTAIERRRHTAADQLLYTLDTIEPGKQESAGHPPLFFLGQIRCNTDQANVLKQWLPQIQWLGQGRSRGLGQIKLKLVNNTEKLKPLAERLNELDQAVRKEWPFYQRVAHATPLAPDTHFFSLDLLSPTIFTRFGLPSVEPDLADLQLDGKAIICRAFVERETIGGWHMGAGLPRRTLLATAMGSVYLIKTTGLSVKELVERLQPVEANGLGLERGRGFGRVLISSPFHTIPEVNL